MRRARNPSPPTFFDELLYRYTQNPAFAELHKPFDCFAAAIGVGTGDGNKACDWLSVLGDGDLLATRNPVEKGGEMGFRLVGTDLCGHSYTNWS